MSKELEEKDMIEAVVDNVLMSISNTFEKMLNIHGDIATSLHEISEFLYNKDKYKDGITKDESGKEEETESVPVIKKGYPGVKSTSDKLFDFTIKTETEKALLIINNTTGLVAWIPRKALKFMDETSITLHDWFKGKVKWQEDKVF